uniref:Uncharacterized protein n=1 Tax=Anguilla anguilla TaxID=7936 RepID=A0A0E9QMG0_ANGAN
MTDPITPVTLSGDTFTSLTATCCPSWHSRQSTGRHTVHQHS